MKVLEAILNQSTIFVTGTICVSGIGYLYFELRNTYRKIARERFFERVRLKMQEEGPNLRQRIIANMAEYPKTSGQTGAAQDELRLRSVQEKQELIVQSQLMKDLDKLYIYASIDETELHRFSSALREKIKDLRINISQRQQMVHFLEYWYQGHFGEEHLVLSQFYVPRRHGTENKLLLVMTKKLIEERGEEFIRRQRARIFESFRSIVQMTG
jgi:hypothetical protein